MQQARMTKAQENIRSKINKWADIQDPEIIKSLAAFNKQFNGVLDLKSKVHDAKTKKVDSEKQEEIYNKSLAFLCNLELQLMKGIAEGLLRELDFLPAVREEWPRYRGPNLLKKYMEAKRIIRQLNSWKRDWEEKV